MNPKKLGKWESVVIVICIIIFVSLSFIVMFRSEWLDSIFYGELPEEAEVYEPQEFEEVSNDEFLEYYDTGDESSHATFEIENGSLYLSLAEPTSVTGIELAFEKDDSLEIEDFVCSDPFECMFFDVFESEVSLLAVISPEAVEEMGAGNVLIGDFEYSGSGNMYINERSETFVSDLENPQVNVWKSSDVEFFLE